MSKPYSRSTLAGPRNLQFTHFGPLDAGKQSKASLVTSIVVNGTIAVLVVLLGLAAKKVSDSRPRVTTLVDPVVIKPLVPEIVQPRVLPRLPDPPKIPVQPPKIAVPVTKAPDVPTPTVVHMTQPVPVVAPAAPRKVVAAAAPAVVSLARAEAASVPNNSARPSAVALGRSDNPIAPSNAPATASVNLGQRGVAGMPASNTGGGPVATHVSLGSGSAGSASLTGNGARPVQGVKLGVLNGTGPNSSLGRVAGPVNLGQAITPTMPKPPTQVRRSCISRDRSTRRRPVRCTSKERFRFDCASRRRAGCRCSGSRAVLAMASTSRRRTPSGRLVSSPRSMPRDILPTGKVWST